MDMATAAPLFRLLGDEARLRLLRVLSLEQLNVTELTASWPRAIRGVAAPGAAQGGWPGR